MNHAIERRIQDRGYQTPNRARAAIARAKLSPRTKTQLHGLVDVWENESEPPPLVGGLAEVRDDRPVIAPPTEIIEGTFDTVGGDLSAMGSTKLERPLAIHLAATIRARLTPYGVSILWHARNRVPVPDNLMETGGVWETTLAFFMVAMGPHLEGGGLTNEPPTVAFRIELLDPRV